MSLFELFRQKQIRITPETQVVIRYITAEKALDLFALAEGELLLVKKQITYEDRDLLSAYPGHCTVFTMRPTVLETLDAIKELPKTVDLEWLEAIGLNYLHFKDTLLVFGEFSTIQSAACVPNVVCISPVHRDEIETQLSINLEAIQSVLSTTDTESDRTEVSDEKKQEKTKSDPSVPSEIDLVRKELMQVFEQHYSVVKVVFSGISIESKTVGLTEFYKKNGIEKGRLRGSWIVFNRDKLAEEIDVGIAKRAIEAVYRKTSVSIPAYGRIIRADRIEEFRTALQKIEEDYRRYLSGDPECKRIGDITVTKPFNLGTMIDASFRDLLNYLIEICPVKGLETEKYILDVKHFVSQQQNRMGFFADKVGMYITESDYKENQWSDHNFLSSFYRSVCNNPDFFDSSFTDLLIRYINLLYPKK